MTDVKHRSVQLLLFFLLSVFVFDQVAEMMSLDANVAVSVCCELNEVEELSEFGSRLRTFEPTDLCFISVLFDLMKDRSFSDDDLFSKRSLTRTFSPHALHVPIYLDKCAILI